MNSKNPRGPEKWVRRRPRAKGPGGRFIRDSAGNAIWVRTRATDPPTLVVDPALFHTSGNFTAADTAPPTTDHLLPVLTGDVTSKR